MDFRYIVDLRTRMGRITFTLAFAAWLTLLAQPPALVAAVIFVALYAVFVIEYRPSFEVDVANYAIEHLIQIERDFDGVTVKATQGKSVHQGLYVHNEDPRAWVAVWIRRVDNGDYFIGKARQRAPHPLRFLFPIAWNAKVTATLERIEEEDVKGWLRKFDAQGLRKRFGLDAA